MVELEILVARGRCERKAPRKREKGSERETLRRLWGGVGGRGNWGAGAFQGGVAYAAQAKE